MGHIQQFSITFSNTIGHSASTKDGTCHLMKMCDWMHAFLKDLKRTCQNIVNLCIQSFICSSYFGCQTWLSYTIITICLNPKIVRVCKTFHQIYFWWMLMLIIFVWPEFGCNLCIQVAFNLLWYENIIHPSIHMNISFESWMIQNCVWKCDNY